ncbi:MAG: HAD family hydrolase [Candidatus Nanopelagicales bacterium]
MADHAASDVRTGAVRPRPDVPLPPDDGPLPADIGVRAGGSVSVDPDAPIPVPDDVALVGSDLDGTLLNSALQVGQRARGAIPQAVASGIGFVYVTGRPPRWLSPVVRQTGHAGMAVCANGALLVDLAQERLVRRTAIDHDLAVTVALRLRELVPGITFALERLLAGAERTRGLGSLTMVGFEPAYDPPWARMPDVESGDIVDLLGRGEPVKVLAAPPAGAGHDSDSMLALAEAEFAEVLHITHSGARAGLIEIMAGEIDKGIGFLEVADMLGIDAARTVAVGDMPNDVPLIRAAGTGYAVANAHPSARAAADHVVPSNEDDGVGRLLEALLAGRP